MSTKSIKEKKAIKEAERAVEDIKLYRLMIEFGLAVLLIFLTMFGKNNGLALMPTLMRGLVCGSGILFAASAVYFTVGKKKDAGKNLKIVTRTGLFGNAAVLFLSCFSFYLFWDAEMITVSVIAALVLYFVYNIYGGAYFAYSLVAGIGFVALETAGKLGTTMTTLSTMVAKGAVAAAFIVPAAAIVLAIVYTASKKLSAKGLVGVILSSAIVLCGAVFTVVNPAYVIYAVFALIAFYLISTVAYTVKKM